MRLEDEFLMLASEEKRKETNEYENEMDSDRDIVYGSDVAASGLDDQADRD
jgi:hypothetical protein